MMYISLYIYIYIYVYISYMINVSLDSERPQTGRNGTIK